MATGWTGRRIDAKNGQGAIDEFDCCTAVFRSDFVVLDIWATVG